MARAKQVERKTVVETTVKVKKERNTFVPKTINQMDDFIKDRITVVNSMKNSFIKKEKREGDQDRNLPTATDYDNLNKGFNKIKSAYKVVSKNKGSSTVRKQSFLNPVFLKEPLASYIRDKILQYADKAEIEYDESLFEEVRKDNAIIFCGTLLTTAISLIRKNENMIDEGNKKLVIPSDELNEIFKDGYKSLRNKGDLTEKDGKIMFEYPKLQILVNNFFDKDLRVLDNEETKLNGIRTLLNALSGKKELKKKEVKEVLDVKDFTDNLIKVQLDAIEALMNRYYCSDSNGKLYTKKHYNTDYGKREFKKLMSTTKTIIKDYSKVYKKKHAVKVKSKNRVGFNLYYKLSDDMASYFGVNERGSQDNIYTSGLATAFISNLRVTLGLDTKVENKSTGKMDVVSNFYVNKSLRKIFDNTGKGYCKGTSKSKNSFDVNLRQVKFKEIQSILHKNMNSYKCDNIPSVEKFLEKEKKELNTIKKMKDDIIKKKKMIVKAKKEVNNSKEEHNKDKSLIKSYVKNCSTLERDVEVMIEDLYVYLEKVRFPFDGKAAIFN